MICYVIYSMKERDPNHLKLRLDEILMFTVCQCSRISVHESFIVVDVRKTGDQYFSF